MGMIYHLVPPVLRGTILYPLNRLKEIHPNLYQARLPEYMREDREWILESRVECFDCSWSDVLFFTPVHPSTLRTFFENAGITVRPLRFFEIDTSTLDPERTAIMHYRRSRLEERKYEAFDANHLSRYRDIAAHAIEEHRKDQFEGRKILLFRGTFHILHKGEVNIAEARIVAC